MNLDPQLGETQRALLERAAASVSGQVLIDPKRDNARWCAAKRMIRRGYMARYVFGGAGFGTLTVYAITDKGREKLRKGTR